MVESHSAQFRWESAKTEIEPLLSTTVRLSEVVSAGLRLEAGAHSLAARAALNVLEASAYSLCPVFGPNGLCKEASNAFRFKRVYVGPDRGIPFISSSDIISMDPSPDHFLSRAVTNRLPDLIVKKWDVLVSCSGTVGNIGLASDSFAGFAVSQHVIRISAPDSATAGYVTAFLRSRFGRPQLQQASYGSVVVHIEPIHLQNVLIPEVPNILRVAIGEEVTHAYALRDIANDKLREANRLLLENLGLVPYSDLIKALSDPPVSEVKASELVGRFDATFHGPESAAILAQLRKSSLELTEVGDPQLSLAINAITKFRERVYVEQGGIPLLSSKQIFQIDPIEVKRLARGAHLADMGEIGLMENMLLISRSGTVGRVQIVPAYMNGWAGSEHTHRILPVDPVTGGYLYAWLASEYGQGLLRRYSYGSVIVHIDREMLAAVPVPLPSRKIRDEIGSLVIEANRLRNDAWVKERSAIDYLESIIEPPVRKGSEIKGTSYGQ